MKQNIKKSFLIPTIIGLCMLAPFFLARAQSDPEQPPNVLFIICDDLNTVVYHPADKPRAQCPNIDALRERAVTFTRAYANDPLCGPSRASMMSGMMPHRSNLTWFEPWRDNEMLRSSVHLLHHFKNNGYRVFGTGKLYHNGEEDYSVYDAFGPTANFGPFPWKGVGSPLVAHPAMTYLFDDFAIPHHWEQTFGRLSDVPEWEADSAAGVPGYRGWRLSGQPFRYESATDRDSLPDEMYANFARQILAQEHTEPFFLGVGFCRPHTPLYVPDNYFDRFPLDEIVLPRTIDNDLADCAPQLADTTLYGFRRYQWLRQPGNDQLLKRWVQAYLASVAFVDEQVGKVLTALAQSPYADNTIVILTSDHGFHMGEKEFLYKQSAWSEAAQIPLVIAGPGIGRAECDQPVSLVDIYPTLIEACDLPPDPNRTGNGVALDGTSMIPLLRPATGAWAGPDYALTLVPGEDHTTIETLTAKPDPHYALSQRDWRYIQTADGGEELYHVQQDPNEWRNLAQTRPAPPIIDYFRRLVVQEKRRTAAVD